MDDNVHIQRKMLEILKKPLRFNCHHTEYTLTMRLICWLFPKSIQKIRDEVYNLYKDRHKDKIIRITRCNKLNLPTEKGKK